MNDYVLDKLKNNINIFDILMDADEDMIDKLTKEKAEFDRVKENDSNLYCECLRWARIDNDFFTNHHPKCEKYNFKEEAKTIISDLIRGIESWAKDEDGIHDDCWDAYRKAKFFIGEYEKQ